MATANSNVRLVVELPADLLPVVERVAKRHRTSVEEALVELAQSGLAAELSIDEALGIARQAHAQELAREGREDQTSDELWEQMKRIREEVARELPTR